MDIKVGAIPTMPSRLPYLLQAVDSLAGQLDRLYICLNRFEQIPNQLKNIPGIYPVIPPRDFGSIGRFYFTRNIIGPYYYFCMDDDLYYPECYIGYLIAKIEQVRRRAVVSLHGRVMADEITHWNNSRAALFPCLQTVKSDAWAHVGGTGVLGFHSDTLKISTDEFRHRNYDDFEFSILMQRRRIPILIAAHEEGFLKYLHVPSEETIFNQTIQNPGELTKIAQSIKWELLSLSL
jgi:hypothetical protein